MTRGLFRLIVVATTAALILYSIFILVEPTPRGSLVYVAHGLATRWVTVPWAMGLLMGHWLAPHPPLVLVRWRLGMVGVLSAAVVGANILTNIPAPPLSVWAAGALTGAVLWGGEDA